MKRLKHYVMILSCLALSGSVFAQNTIKDDPAYIDIDSAFDLKVIKPEVNINIPKFLLKAALSEFDGSENDPIANMGLNIDELTSGIKLVRLMVFNADSEKQETITKGVASLKKSMSGNWIPIIEVAESDENVMIYAHSDATGEKLTGLAMVVMDGSDVVIGNLVGHVPISKIAKIAVLLGEDMIPGELLKKLESLQGEEKEN